MIWLALVIPVVTMFIAWRLYPHKVIWLEAIAPIVICAVIIVIFKHASVAGLTSDTVYHGSLVTRARYFEAWETYVERTCTESYVCGQDSKGQPEYCTRTYDCSYCDTNDEKWEAYDTEGNTWRISESKYNELASRWKSGKEFVELNRSINHGGWGCGKDGDAYEIGWNSDIYTSEPATFDVSYTNKIQASPNAFAYLKIDNKKASQLGLYEYPPINNLYSQPCLMGMDKFNIARKDSICKLFTYFNGKYGSEKHIKVFVCLFNGQSISKAFEQESFWNGGNRNEVVICIDMDSLTLKLNWVKAFSWCDNKRVHVDIREDVMQLKYMDFFKLYDILHDRTLPLFNPKDFEDFDYLTVPVPTWAIITTYIIVLLCSIGISIYAVRNEYDNTDF